MRIRSTLDRQVGSNAQLAHDLRDGRSGSQVPVWSTRRQRCQRLASAATFFRKKSSAAQAKNSLHALTYYSECNEDLLNELLCQGVAESRQQYAVERQHTRAVPSPEQATKPIEDARKHPRSFIHHLALKNKNGML